MPKKIFLVISFITVFFCQAPLVTPKILAASDSEETAFEKIWNAIINALFPQQITIKIDGTKESQISTINSKEKFTEYGKQDKDWSHRTLTESLRKKFIGIWFNEVITREGLFGTEHAYSDEVVAEAKDNCPEVKISDIVYYYATKTNQKILYARGNSSPIDYPANIEHENSIGPGSCYENAYKGIQSVPQGIFQGKGDAALSSTQLNDQLRYTLPNNLQGDPTVDNASASNTETLTEDNLKHLKITRVTYMTQETKDKTDCSNTLTDEEKMYNLYKNFQKSIKPQKWIAKVTTDNDIGSKEYEKGIPITECSSGNGLSQYGAEGMALKGKTSEEILTAYYGIGNDYGSGIMAFGNIDTSATDKITVRLAENKNSPDCDAIVNMYPDRFEISGDPNLSPLVSDQLKQQANEAGIYRTLTLTVEDYLLGIGEIGLNWKLAAHQALIVAARTVAYYRSHNGTQSISDSKAVQVFLCSRLLTNLNLIDNGKSNVQIDAVGLTTGKVITENGSIFGAQYLRCFGGPNSSGPKFNGLNYEKLAGVVDNQELKGTCDDFVPFPNKTTKSTPSTIGDLYIFPGSVHGTRIGLNDRYDLATTSESQYLQTYSGNCRLDKRIHTAVGALIKDAQAAIPNLNVNLISCYRSTAEQQAKWDAKVAEKNGDEKAAAIETARPGQSAHQTGRAIDFGDPSALDKSSALHKWLVANASKYGFYPYEEEAWHWEYNP